MKKDTLTEDGSVKRFVDHARRFCSLVENCKQYNLIDFEEKSLELLSGLYYAATNLPWPEKSSDDLPPDFVTAEEGRKIVSALTELFGEYDFYRIVDPFGQTEEIGGYTIGCDLEEIYTNIKNSLVLFDKGGDENIADAVWQWHFDFMSHWGYHSINAIRAIHYHYY